MREPRGAQGQVRKGLIAVAVVLLAGIVVVAAGWFGGNNTALYAGLLITLAGVLTGIQQLLVARRS